ncbi:hypothetical protein NXW71_02000 [Parabacteroides merdae]|nr:hypothetical protein [Parabacteroides merdae]
MSYDPAIRMPDKADEIVATQQARITNPDRKRQYAFISPSVSPRQEVRDSVFASLLVAENRRVEPWASAALSNLNCQLRQKKRSVISVRHWKPCRKYSVRETSFFRVIGYGLY